MTTRSVIGAGSWGTAIAQLAAENSDTVYLWSRTHDHASEINAAQANEKYLAGIALKNNIKATGELEIAMQSDIIFLVTPAQAMRQILNDMKPFIRKNHILVLCSKGIELSSGKLMSDVVKEVLPNTPVCILTGPNFAVEIARGKPAATTLACEDTKIGETVQDAITALHFRPYITHDLIGAQLAGALKNVIAIACGIAHGLNMGESARASLVTRGLAEIARLGVAMGAEYETFLGQCGIGDMMLTCSSEKSRNFSLGLALGQGKTLDEILGTRGTTVTEGVHTAKAAIALAQEYEVEMPITLAVHKCLNEGLSLDDALEDMLNRPVGHEHPTEIADA